MNVEYTKEDKEPSYDNLTTTVGATKKTSKSYGIRQIVTKPIFKWTVLVTIVTVLTIIIVVPTVLEITKEESINGNWGNWTSFSDCSHFCGGGTQYRIRNCDNPSPVFGGDWCSGNDTDFQSCNNEPCPDHGGWGKWMSFSGCSVSCGGGTHTRQRQCDSPSPAYGGDYCSGNENETQWCNTDVCPVHGSWGSWTEVSRCSHSCGRGTKYRIRECNNPIPSYGGNWCLGNITEFQQCNTQACPEYKSAFTVSNPKDFPSYGYLTLTFKTVTTNIGGHYDTSKGRFTCHFAGIYGQNQACLYIRKNGSNIVLANSDPDSSSASGLYESSNSVVLHLTRGDRVDVGGCTTASTMHPSYQMTSFSGFLLYAD